MCPDTDFQVSIVAVAAISPGHRNRCATWPNVMRRLSIPRMALSDWTFAQFRPADLES